jgi:hypothetical protein
MDRQTLRDCVHRFNEHGPDGLKDNCRPGNPRRLSKAQQQELAALVEAGPDRAFRPQGRDAQEEDRDLVPGRGPHRPEERSRPAIGAQGNAARPARRPALRERIPVWRDLPGQRRRRGAGAALRRHRHDATPHRRDIPPPRRGAHAALLLDRAGWHIAGDLVWPRNITPILLPSRSPELNPVENIWQYLRANYLSTASSKPTTRSSTQPARPGDASPTGQTSSHQSECASGRISVNCEGCWYYSLALCWRKRL